MRTVVPTRKGSLRGVRHSMRRLTLDGLVQAMLIKNAA